MERHPGLLLAGFEHSREGIFLIGEDGRFHDVNPAACAALGYTREELLHLTLSDIDPDFQPVNWQARWHNLRDRGSGRMESRHRHRSGRIFPVEINVTFFTYQGVEYDLAFSRDISDRKQAEEALRQSEEKFSHIFRSAPYVNLLTRLVDGQIIDINDAFTRITGYTADEAIGKSTTDLNLWATQDQQIAMVAEMRRNQRVRNLETKFRDKNGHVIPCLFSAETLIVGGQICVFSSIEDISDRKEAEESLKSRNNFLAALQDTTIELIAQLDLNLLLENIARRAGQLVGTDSCFLDLVDDTTGQLIPHVGTGALVESLHHIAKPGEGVAGTVWQTGQPLVINEYDQWENRLADYTPGTLKSIAGVPLLSGDKVIGVLGLAFDAQSQRTFGPETVDFLTQLARLAIIAIENARLFASAQQELNGRRQAEARLTDQLDELRRWYTITLGREARILELKKEVNDLLIQAGLPPRYNSVLEIPNAY